MRVVAHAGGPPDPGVHPRRAARPRLRRRYPWRGGHLRQLPTPQTRQGRDHHRPRSRIPAGHRVSRPWHRNWSPGIPSDGGDSGDRPGPGPDAARLRMALRRSIVQITAGMTVVLLLMGWIALLLVNNTQSKALDAKLGAVLAQADDVGDPPEGSYLARLRPGSRQAGRPAATVEITPGAPAPVARLLSDILLTGAAEPPGGQDSIELPPAGTYRIRVTTRTDGQRWAIASDLTALRADQRDVFQALLLAEVAGVAGALAAALLLSRRSVQPLARALQLQRRFVADASHELRAPLTILHTRAQILAADPAAEPGSALGKGLRGLVEDTRALGEVIGDLLASAEPVQVMGHPTALRRAVTALVDNAVRNTPAGGRVDISTTTRDDRAELVVADTGVGFEPDQADELFTRSFHHSTGEDDQHDDGHRFGLGLALVRETAAAHGGSIT